ncbi:hypothetical protein BV898_14679 [Hypsibius exemplaris]|uniref:Receptor ligand binding region domain-containing protein n=1 Tax=Hypsibius exemplaris TaxID=2072580 RepID=A0A9X6NIV0_HYPEX|nr:hypothetical protein BV898_14679 [Hypsibius exemplaris]
MTFQPILWAWSIVFFVVQDPCCSNGFTTSPTTALPQITIVVFGQVTAQGTISLSVMEPPMEVAYEKIKSLYKDRFSIHYVRTLVPPCLSALQANEDPKNMLAWWFYQLQSPDHVVIFISPGWSPICPASDTSVSFLASNWNALLIYTTAAVEINDRSALSTLISAPSISIPQFIDLSVALIAHYNWTSIFALWDESSAPVFRSLFNGFQARLDRKARKAFQSVLLVQSAESNDDETSNKTNSFASTKNLALEFRRRSLAKYNATYAPGNDWTTTILDSYTDVLLIGQVLNETWANGQNITNGRGLADRFLNRTFLTPESGSVLFDANGVRQALLTIAHYDAVHDIRQPFLVRSNSGRQFLRRIGKDIDWPGGQFPPPSVPVCGFRGICNVSTTTKIIAGSVTMILLVLLVAGAFWVRWFRQHIFEAENYWILQRSDLHLPGFKGQSRLSLLFSCVSINVGSF